MSGQGREGTKGVPRGPVPLLLGQPLSKAVQWNWDGSAPAGSLPHGGTEALASEAVQRPGPDRMGFRGTTGPGERRSAETRLGRWRGGWQRRRRNRVQSRGAPEWSRRPPPARCPALTMATRSRPHHTSGERCWGGRTPTARSLRVGHGRGHCPHWQLAK